MFLIGQYDSPFVRRVAIALRLYGITFEHKPWSTFGDADALGRDLAPATGRGTQIDHRHAGFEQMKLVVDLGEFEGRARAKALAFGARHIGIV